MDKKEIYNRIAAVCEALNNISVTGVQNAGNLVGCYSILNEICVFLQRDISNPSNKADTGEK